MDNFSEQPFRDLVTDYFQFAYRKDPLFATEVGIHNYDSYLPDFSKNAVEEHLGAEKGFLERLEAISERGLSLDNQIDFNIVRSHIRENVRDVEVLNYFQIRPETYVLYAMWGVYQLLIRDFAPVEDRMKSALSRLLESPQLLSQGRANLTRPPKVFTEIAIEAARDSLGFYRQMVPSSAAEVPSLREELIAAAERAASAMEEYIQFLEQDLLPRSDGEFAVGTAIFEELLHDKHHLTYTADELLQVGQDQYAGIRRKMADLAKEIDPEGDVSSVMAQIRANHPEPDELVNAYRAEMLRARTFAFDRNLVTVPVQEELELRDTPPGLRGIIPYAMYLPPAPFEDAKLGTFFVTPIDMEADAEARENQLQSHSRYIIPVIALHEGYPGHHLQLVWANTHPSLVRKHLWNTLYVEGWAFYCEELMQEHGFLEDPRSQLARLDAELWRAARIIIDVSLHTHQMSIDEAVALLVESGRDPSGSKAEVRRYIMNPTQPMSYLIGKLEIMKLAERYRAEKGDGFNLMEFHEALLRCGSIPPALAAWQLFGRD